MAEVRYDKSHHAGATPEARIAARLRNSGGDHADVCVQKGDGPTRTFTNIHHSAGQHSLKHTSEERREAAPHAAMQDAMQKETDK
jgi:hypothetical protein